MTLDEAIISAKEVSEIHRRIANIECEDGIDDDIKMNCLNYAEEHEQLAVWLEELKAYRIQHDLICEKHHVNTIENIYNKAIDDFCTEICKTIVQSERNGNYRFYAVEIKQSISDLGEQLKVVSKWQYIL